MILKLQREIKNEKSSDKKDNKTSEPDSNLTDSETKEKTARHNKKY